MEVCSITGFQRGLDAFLVAGSWELLNATVRDVTSDLGHA